MEYIGNKVFGQTIWHHLAAATTTAMATGVNGCCSLFLLSLKPFSVTNQTAELLVTLVKQLVIGPSLGKLAIMELYSLSEHSRRFPGLIKG